MSSRTATPGEPVEAGGAQQATTAAMGDRDEPGGRYSLAVGVERVGGGRKTVGALRACGNARGGRSD